MFGFRVSNILDSGIGHLMRMKHLANALTSLKQQVFFILDQPCTVSTQLLEGYQLAYVTPNNYQLTEEQDAEVSLSLLKLHRCNQIIIDSYSLSYKFESVLYDALLRVIVFDDNERQHLCHVLVDQKWVGKQTLNRYQELVPGSCQRLLGPQYTILHPDYELAIALAKGEDTNRSNVLFSLGGGGDLAIFVKLWRSLTECDFSPQITFDVVIGPKAENIKAVESLACQYPQINLVKEAESLAPYYARAKLFVGALGTSFYECAAMALPAITFSLADNQKNDHQILEYLGHYLHLGKLPEQKFTAVAQLVYLAYQSIDRLRALQSSAAVKVDALGAKRLALIFTGENQKNKLNIKEYPVQGEILTEELQICEVDDRYLNHYLLSRNRTSNSKQMTISEKISPVDHYLWWFKQTRENYLLYRLAGNKRIPLLYIWHQKYMDKYLYGGWFTAGEEVPFNLAMLALKWQLKMSKKQYPQAVWLAVINKENKFVNLLNQYMGFVEIAQTDKEYRVTQEIFPKASAEQFNFVRLACKDIKE